jgi:hypothetical protein
MENKLMISVENNSLNIVRTVSPVSERDFLIVDLELDELKELAPSEAAYRVGATVLNLLAHWHPNEFGEWKVPPPSDGE